ncbi:MAG: family 43 glycosylhydrolase [Thermoguttaceae bacterium]|nr:family 43 glycosylhydrolase [Thermoguttaceae bacterium]
MFRTLLSFVFATLAAVPTFADAPSSDSAAPFPSVVYRNPVASAETPDAWPDYGFGDPFVLRFNGRYYLYPSTRDDQIGVRCWSSRDLTNWRYEGVCCVDPTSKGAYAPEVFRWNDAFYMITSPAGRGHYVYRAAAPVGPFERVTENFGLSIDGSAFIDDEPNAETGAADAYFYSAADPAILAYRMKAPNVVDPKPLATKLNMRGWTEGPNVFRVDGVYYATYCGNHVFSRGYRIDAASGPSPLDLSPVPDNPVLVSTEGAPVGIGHNSVVKGPNLDLYYLAYHTLLGRGKVRGWPVRDARIDRLVLNRDVLTVVGPTRTPQTLPLPDAAAWFDADADLARLEPLAADADANSPETAPRLENGFLRLGADAAVLLRDAPFDADFTAEFNVALPNKTGEAGALFAYRDAQNFGRVEIDGATNRVRVVLTVDGEETATEAAPASAFGETVSFASLRSVQVERTGSRYAFYVDDRKLAELENAALDGGKIGYFTSTPDALFGFLGATAATEGRSAARLAEPVPGALSFAYRSTVAGKAPVEVATKSGKRRRVAELRNGDAISLELDVAEAGLYDAALRYSAPEQARATLEIAGSAAPQTVEIALAPTQDGAFATALRRRIALPRGKVRLRIAAAPGSSFLLSRLDLTQGAALPEKTDFAPRFDATAYSDGAWEVVDGALVSQGKNPFGKRLYGDAAWGDYRVDATLEFLDGRPNGGLVFRVQAPALGGPNNSPKLGTNFFRGYFVGFARNAVVLGKHEFDWKELARNEFRFEPNKKIDLRIEARSGEIVVFVDGAEALRCVDDAPFVSGRVGVRACDAALRVDRFSVASLE